MNNLIEIQVQIEKLQKQAKEIRTKEFDRTVYEIVAQMRAFGITAKDLQSALGKSESTRRAQPAKSRPAKSAKSVARTVAPKYRGPNDETWTGRGLMPRWLSALVVQGRTKDEFAIVK